MIINKFPLLDSSNSHYKNPYCPYWFNNRQSESLVVTAGASWTWGNGVPDMFETENSSITEQDHAYRKHHVYGALVAQELTADFLCLAANGSSNFFAASRISELLDMDFIDRYKKIYLIWTSTDPGKGFNSLEDRGVDYYSFLQNQQPLNNVLAFMNKNALNRFWHKLQNNKKIIFRFGTDWVDQIGFDEFDAYQISNRPWLFSMKETYTHQTRECFVYQDFAIDRLVKYLPEFGVPNEVYKTWIIDLADRALERFEILEQQHFKPLFKTDHPTGLAHKQWAELILNTL